MSLMFINDLSQTNKSSNRISKLDVIKRLVEKFDKFLCLIDLRNFIKYFKLV